MQYPSSWPKPNNDKPEYLQSRISEQQKHELFNRIVTTRDLAKLLNVHEKYLSNRFPSKVVITDKKPLTQARMLYKLEVARQVLRGLYSIQQAANVAHVSYNTMQRCVQKAKQVSPELVKPYIAIVLAQKQQTIKRARDARKPSATV